MNRYPPSEKKTTLYAGKEMKFYSNRMAFSSLWLGMERYSEFGWNVVGDGNNGSPRRQETERMSAKEGLKDWEAE